MKMVNDAMGGRDRRRRSPGGTHRPASSGKRVPTDSLHRRRRHLAQMWAAPVRAHLDAPARAASRTRWRMRPARNARANGASATAAARRSRLTTTESPAPSPPRTSRPPRRRTKHSCSNNPSLETSRRTIEHLRELKRLRRNRVCRRRPVPSEEQLEPSPPRSSLSCRCGEPTVFCGSSSSAHAQLQLAGSKPSCSCEVFPPVAAGAARAAASWRCSGCLRS